jgi:hypothetical protein
MNVDNEQTNLIQRLNSHCFCISLDQQALHLALAREAGEPDLFELLQERCPTVFAARPVFVSQAQMTRMSELIAAIESVLALPAYREEIRAHSLPIAKHSSGALGVFMGYDFHATESDFGLIEINTNAGGALLNALMARARRTGCPEVAGLVPPPAQAESFESSIVTMFRQEWALAGRDRTLRSIAIVDEESTNQYLYPEFMLFKKLFEDHGIETVIADPADLELRSDTLWHGDVSIDLVYNRLTDFLLESKTNNRLLQAYLADATVLTPHPEAHALYADKRNLVLLSSEAHLLRLGVPEDIRRILLAGIPHTEQVHRDKADRLWSQRKGLFFKPAAGYGGRAAYRGDKLTRRVWEEILAGEYVAQALIAPGLRVLDDNEAPQVLKFDLRNYVYIKDRPPTSAPPAAVLLRFIPARRTTPYYESSAVAMGFG